MVKPVNQEYNSILRPEVEQQKPARFTSMIQAEGPTNKTTKPEAAPFASNKPDKDSYELADGTPISKWKSMIG